MNDEWEMMKHLKNHKQRVTCIILNPSSFQSTHMQYYFFYYNNYDYFYYYYYNWHNNHYKYNIQILKKQQKAVYFYLKTTPHVSACSLQDSLDDLVFSSSVAGTITTASISVTTSLGFIYPHLYRFSQALISESLEMVQRKRVCTKALNVA